MTQELDKNIKELIVEAKSLFDFLDSQSNLVINLENNLRAIHANFPFSYNIGTESNATCFISWENEENNTKNYRLFLIKVIEETTVIKKAIIEMPIKERLALIKHLDAFVVAFKEYLKSIMEQEGI